MGTPNRRPTCSWDPPPQRHGFTLNGLGATACAPAARPTTLAEGRSCLGVGPTRKPVLKGLGFAPSLCKTERRARGLDSVARDNPAESLMAQDRWCLPYPNSTGPGPRRQGVGPAWGWAPASDCWLNTFTRRDAQPSAGHLP